MEQNVKLPEK